MSRDFDYEANNIGYDIQYPYPDGGIKCINYHLCEAVLPKWWFDCRGNYLCINCNNFGWKQLVFKEMNEDCNVCFEHHSIFLKFPACEHYFCLVCSRNILFWDETRYHINPCLFGCPPCPNGCVNPLKGHQCYCEEYDIVIEEWSNREPLEYKIYVEKEEESIANSPPIDGEVYASRKCPLCRQEYEQK
jgi:hypothetical protein